MLRRLPAALAGLLAVSLIPDDARAAEPRWPVSSPSVADGLGVTDQPFDLAVTPGGVQVLLYESEVSGGGIDRVYVVTRKPGGSWSAPKAISAPGHQAGEPKVASRADGTVVAGYVFQAANGDFRVQTRTRMRNGSWTAPRFVSPKGFDAGLQAVSTNAGVDAFGWQYYDGSTQRIAARVHKADGTWAKAKNLSAPAPWLAGGVSLGVTTDGQVFAAWRQYQGATTWETHMRRFSKAGKWKANTKISRDGFKADAARVAVGRQGQVVIAWQEDPDPGDVRTVVWRRTAKGVSSRAIVSPVLQDSSFPVPTVMPNGTIVVAYQRNVTTIESVAKPPGQPWQPAQTVSPDRGVTVYVTGLEPLKDGDLLAIWFVAGPDATFTSSVRHAGAWGGDRDVVGPDAGLDTLVLRTDNQGNAFTVASTANGGDTEFLSTPGDAFGPTTTMTKPRKRTLRKTTAVRWRSVDRVSPLDTYWLIRQDASWNAQPGAWNFVLAPTTKVKTSATVKPGTTACFRARADDTAGWAGSWSKRRCVTRPVDDRVAKRQGFANITGPAYYQHTARRSDTHGARLVYRHVVAKKLSLLVAKGPGNGTIDVLWKGKLVKTLSLSAAANKSKVVVPVKKFAKVRTGNLTIRVSSFGLPVRVDGLYAEK